MFAIVSKATKTSPSKVLLLSNAIKPNTFFLFEMIDGLTVHDSCLARIHKKQAQEIPLIKEVSGIGLDLSKFMDAVFMDLLIKELSKPAKVKELCCYLKGSTREAVLWKVKTMLISGTVAEKYILAHYGEKSPQFNLYVQFFWDIKSGCSKGKDSEAKIYVSDIDFKATCWEIEQKHKEAQGQESQANLGQVSLDGDYEPIEEPIETSAPTIVQPKPTLQGTIADHSVLPEPEPTSKVPVNPTILNSRKRNNKKATA